MVCIILGFKQHGLSEIIENKFVLGLSMQFIVSVLSCALWYIFISFDLIGLADCMLLL